MQRPLAFQPYLRPMVWGGRRLGEQLGKVLPTPEPYGESWEISAHSSHSTQLLDAPITLQDLMDTERTALLGPAAASYTRFPWLVKFLDANDWLSVQVHPDSEAVGRLWPGEEGKTEAWFVLDAAPTSRVYAGLLPGVDENVLRAALLDGTAASCLHQFTPQPGDCLFLPAGTVHAVGGGVLMAEIQQTSDATFRLFDWNRRDAQGKSRQLHLEEGLASIHWDYGPVEPIRVPGYPRPGMVSGDAMNLDLVKCQYFDLQYVRQQTPIALPGSGALRVVIGLHGGATLRSGDQVTQLGTGQTIVLPAACHEVSCVPEEEIVMLLASLPLPK